MRRVYWSTADARRRTVYRCRILPADSSTASESCQEIKSDENCAELLAADVKSSAPLSHTDIAARCFRSAVSVSSDDLSCSKIDQFISAKSDDSVTMQCHDELLMAVNTTVNTEVKPCQLVPSNNYTASHESDSTAACGDFTAPDTALSRCTGDISTCTGCHKSTDEHGNATAVNSRHLMQPSVPAQHRSFTSAFFVDNKTDTSRDAAAERNISVAGLRSDFSAHSELKYVPLKLVSQLDGAVPDSESEASDVEADIPVSCRDMLLKSSVASLYRSYTTKHGVAHSPFRCVKCKRVYRTEESCTLHAAVCTFEVSSSSESDKSDNDGDGALDASDQDTDSCCSDDGVISEYLNSSRNSENTANCSSLGCQTEKILVAMEDCDMNANCKLLCYSDMKKTDHLRLESDSQTVGVKNSVKEQDCDFLGESFTEMLHHSQNVSDAAVLTCSASCVFESTETLTSSACHSVVDFSVQVEETVGNKVPSGAKGFSDGQLTKSSSRERENLACCSRVSDLLDLRASCQLPVYGFDQCIGASMLKSHMYCDSADRAKDVTVTSVEAMPYLSDRVSDYVKSNTADDSPLTGLPRAEFTAVSDIELAGKYMSPLVDSSKTSTEATVSSGYDTVEQCGSFVGKCVGTNASLGTLSSGTVDVPGCVTSSSSACVSSQQHSVKLQDILTSSATMVWPSATVHPSIMSKHSASLVTTPTATGTRQLEAPWASLNMLTTPRVVVPAALPNAVAAACIRPVNIAQPVYAIGHGMIPASAASQPLQQCLRPVLVAPMAWLAPQLALMNVLRLPLIPRPADTSTYAPSQQSVSSMRAANVQCASPRLVLTPRQPSMAGQSHFVLQKTVSSSGFAPWVTATCSQSSSFRLPGYVQSFSRADLSSTQMVHHPMSNAAVSQLISAPLPVAAVPPSLNSPSLSVSINQLHTGCSPSALLMHRVAAAPSSLSVHVTSSAGMFLPWLTGTTSVTANSVSSTESGHKNSLSAGKRDVQATVASIEAENNVSVVPVPGNQWSLTQVAPQLSGLLPVHSIVSAARCSDSMRYHTSHVVSLSVSSANSMSFTPRPHCVTSSPASLPFPTSVVIASCCSPPLTFSHISTETAAAKGLPVASSTAMSPRLIIQPSFIAATTQPEASMNVVRSLSATQHTAVSQEPPVSSRLQHTIARSDALSDAHAFIKAVSTLPSPANRPVPRLADPTERSSCRVDPHLVCSPISTETKASSGK